MFKTYCILFALAVLAAPLLAQTPARQSQEAVLRAGDHLRLRVWPDESMNGEYPIESSGTVHLPLIGALSVAGQSLSMVQARVRELYSAAMKNPVISLTPVFPVAVFGAVASPGVYPTEPTQTVMDVLARAGGFNTRANVRAIRIVRGTGVIKFNAQTALESGSTDSIVLQSGDRIVVSQRSGVSWQGILTVLQLAATGFVIANQLK